MTLMNVLKLVLIIVVLSAGFFAAGFFLTRYLIDSHYLTISFP
jgi:uncharacterized protein YneF (UPF0154 family)